MSKIVTLSEAAFIALHAMVVITRSAEKLNVGQITESIGIVVGLREGNVGADTCLRRDIGALAGV